MDLPLHSIPSRPSSASRQSDAARGLDCVPRCWEQEGRDAVKMGEPRTWEPVSRLVRRDVCVYATWHSSRSEERDCPTRSSSVRRCATVRPWISGKPGFARARIAPGSKDLSARLDARQRGLRGWNFVTSDGGCWLPFPATGVGGGVVMTSSHFGNLCSPSWG